jgi:hypothetical protein
VVGVCKRSGGGGLTSRRQRAMAGGGTATGSSPTTDKQGLLATNRDGETSEMKRRARGTHLGARKGGRGAGGADRGGAVELRRPFGAAVLRKRGEDGEVVRMERELGGGGGLYRAEGEGERAR